MRFESVLFIIFLILLILSIFLFIFYPKNRTRIVTFGTIALGTILGTILIIIICSRMIHEYITANAEYTVEEHQYKIKEINQKQVILDDGKKYKYKFVYDEKAESPYAKIADCQYSKAAKSWYGKSLEDKIVIIYTCIIVNN